jgi:hypothetical protein
VCSSDLPSHIKASAKHKWPKDWSKKSKDKLNKIFPNYSGKAKKIKWERLRKN